MINNFSIVKTLCIFNLLNRTLVRRSTNDETITDNAPVCVTSLSWTIPATYVLKQVGTTKSLSMKEYVPSVSSGNKIENETHLLLDCKRYSSIKDIFLSKLETKIDYIRKLSPENLIS